MEERENRQKQSRQQQGRQAGQQQQGQSDTRQQQQFETGSSQPMSSGAEGSLADRIRPHMDVVDQSGALVGSVDHVEGDSIKLTRSSSSTGEHRYVPLSQVAGIESDQVRLRTRGDTSFGMEA